MRRVLEHYRKQQNGIPDTLKLLEADGSPRPHSLYKYKMMRDYNIPPFAGASSDYPAWWEDDLHYFELQAQYARLPYLIRDIEERISKVKPN